MSCYVFSRCFLSAMATASAVVLKAHKLGLKVGCSFCCTLTLF